MTKLSWLLWSLFCVGLLSGCATERRALVEVDGTRRWVALGETEQSVAELLVAAGVPLGAQDRVEPASFTIVEPNMQVRVIRVRQRELSEERVVPFARQVRRDATLPQGDSRLVQLGQNGVERVIFVATLEDGVEVAREEDRTELVTEPLPEILVVGTRGTGEAVPVAGTIVYMEQGNAWLMRGDSAQKRPLTLTGDLDGHVLALSPDGRWLLFTREPLGGASGQGGPLNTLWLLDTRLTNEEPHALELDSVLWADWHPCPTEEPGCARQIAFSTAERVPTPPGWRAHNDLNRFSLNEQGARGEVVPLLAASNPLFGWWGRNWEWSPNGSTIAWGDATRVGLVEVPSGRERVLAQFLPYESRAAWVWTPQLAWAADGSSLVATIHRTGEAPPPGETGFERTERFDLLRLPLGEGEAELLVAQVGPFAMPQWVDERRLLYGQAEDQTRSVISRYRLMLRRGTTEPRPLFPASGQPGADVPWAAWNPLSNALITVWQGDLYLVPLDGGTARPLTAEGGASRPQWGP